MNDTFVFDLERLLRKKVMLYAQLRDCFIKERECLIGMKVDQLWALSDEKHDLCSRIETLREVIMRQLEPDAENESFDLNRVIREVPHGRRATFQKSHLRLIEIKAEIENLRKENKAFIERSLQFLDEMLSILSGEAMAQPLYDRSSTIRAMENRIHLNSEA